MNDKLCMGCMQFHDSSDSVCPHCGYTDGSLNQESYCLEIGCTLSDPLSNEKDRYIVGRVLGGGGFGVTYIGYDTLLKRRVAIKEYLPVDCSSRANGTKMVTIFTGLAADQYEKGLDSFVNESTKLSLFRSIPGFSGIVEVLDCFLSNNTAYIVMEYIDGESVSSHIKNKGKYEVSEAMEILKGVLTTLTQVHSQGMLHRDIAPDNIMVNSEGEVKLIDFGAARFASTTHSKSLTVLIKSGYAPEEQYRSRGEQGPWTDVYAAAATFYKMVTGITPQDAYERMEDDKLKPPSKLGVKIDRGVEAAVMNALNLRIEDRTQSAEAFLAEIDDEDVKRRIIKQKKHNDHVPLWMKLSIAAMLLVIVGVGIYAFRDKNVELFNNMPILQGDSVAVAEKKVDRYSMLLKIEGTQYSTRISENTVLSQSPKGGTLVSISDQARVIVSAGAQSVLMPDVTYMNIDEIKTIFEDSLLHFTVEYEENSEYADGIIISQSVEAGTAVIENATIKLTVAKNSSIIDESTLVKVPELRGKTIDEARQLLADDSLYLEVNAREYSSNIEAGKIISQSQMAGNKAAKNSTVGIVVSLGIEKVVMPRVVYYSEEEARGMLDAAGFKVTIKSEESEIVARGLVISQSIAENTQVERGSTVEIIISLGYEATVPNVIGKTKNEASSAIKDAGFKVNVQESYSPDIAKGIVISQTPSASAEATKGSSVVIFVSLGKDPSTIKYDIPNINGETENSASQKLLGEGFNVGGRSYEYSTTVPEGCVISYSPSAPSLKGTSVNFVVSKGASASVPSVVDESLSTAENILARAGLNVNRSYENCTESNYYSPGTVMSQSIAEGTTVDRGTVVSLTVSEGVSVHIGNYIGRSSLSSVLEELSRLNVTTRYEYSETADEGTITGQSISAGNSVNEGTAITITVCSGRLAEVPSVVGMSESEARSALSKFSVRVTNELSETYDEGYVVRQNVIAGNKIVEGSTITIAVSSGRLVTVPSVVGMSEEQARSALSRFNVRVTNDYSETYDTGIVINQNTASGQKIAEGSTITITVCIGRCATMPNILGQSVSTAESTVNSALSAVDINVSVSEDYSDSYSEGKIMSQYPSSGSRVIDGTTIRITVSLGSMPTIPNVVGMNEAQAKSTLSIYNVVVTSGGYSDTYAEGIVMSQSPNSGSRLGENGRVTITISEGKNITIPDVTGQMRSAAQSSLSQFNVRVQEQGSENVPVGRVISQTPVGKAPAGTVVTIYVSTGGSWSNWSDSNSAGGSDYETEIRTVYSVSKRSKETTTSTSQSLSGWEYNGVESFGSWSDWVYGNAPAETEILDVETKTEQEAESYNLYCYRAWYTDGRRAFSDRIESWMDTSHPYFTYYSITVPVATFANYTRVQAGGQIVNQEGYFLNRASSGAMGYHAGGNTAIVFIGSTNYRNIYYYRTRNATHFSFYRYTWGDYSDYTTTPASEDSNTQVRTKTQYRWRYIGQ